MTSNASSTLKYLAQMPAERKAPLQELRALCRRHLYVMKKDVVRRILQWSAGSEAAPC